MNKEFRDGSLILVEKTTYLDNGKIGVVLVNGHDATVKK
ncbi:S24 family peptidase [[Brevibacterium] frigoritolerans]|nr:S24 family peptidase [Peribacillus frigoritolerans]